MNTRKRALIWLAAAMAVMFIFMASHQLLAQDATAPVATNAAGPQEGCCWKPAAKK